MTYFAGATVRLVVTYKVNGALVDPTSLTCQVLSPRGVQTSQTPLRTDTGTYQVDVVASEAGTWFVRLVGSGSAAGVVEESFDVLPSRFR